MLGGGLSWRELKTYMSFFLGFQSLARIRFFLVFFLLSLTTFEWQLLVTQRLGTETGGSTLGLSFSIGTLSTVSLLATLAYLGKSLQISRWPLMLLLGNSLISCAVAYTLDSVAWMSSFMFVVTALHASLTLLSLSVEVSAVQLHEGLNYPRVRIFGSLGYLAAAFLSQTWGGMLFPAIIAVVLLVLTLPMIPAGLVATGTNSTPWGYEKFKNIAWLSVIAFILWSVSRGFEVLGPIYLRSSTENGLMWLTVLIVSESTILQWVDRLNSSWVIVGAALMWSIVYGLFANVLSPATVFVALVLAGMNCPAQVVVQSQVGKLFPGVPTAQAALSIAGAAGGFAASLFYAYLASRVGDRILDYCIIQSLIAVPLLIFCVRRVGK